MFKKSTYVICLILLVVVLGNATFHNTSISKNFRKPTSSAFPPQGFTGTTAGLYCNTSGCHNSFTLNTSGGSITAPGLPTAYSPGTAYKFSITVKHGTADRKKWGFSIAAKNSAGQTVGTFSTTNANAGINGTELSHLNAVATNPQSSFTYNNLTWTAPATVGTSDNNITFYFAGVAANNDAASLLDYVYASTTSACALLPIPGSITGPGTACAGSTKTYSITPVAGATSYKWTLPAGATISGSKTGPSIKVVWGSTGGKLKVKALNACGASAARGKSVTINCLLANDIPEAENATTASRLITNAFPNPTHGLFMLQFNSETVANYSVKVSDITGKAVINVNGVSKQGANIMQIDLSKFEKGVYIIQLQQQDGNVVNQKIVLQ